MTLLLRCCLSLLMLLALSARAEAPREVTWEHLAPPASPADNPFAALPPEQLEALVDVASVRDRRARGIQVAPEDLASEQSALAKLREAKVDVDGLLSRRAEIAAKLRAKARATVPALDGALVRMPGYLLPLEFSGKQVSEFLLVPYVGACIHAPPPPPNQIVYVKTDKPFELRGAFDAVWITGRLATRASTRALHLVDGSSDIEIGYSMSAARVEPYK